MRIHITLLAAILLSKTAPVSAGMDDARLKERLTGGLFELMIWKGFDIKKSGVTDEQFHRVLMDLYRETEDKWPTLTPATDEWHYNQKTVEGVLACLPMCGDIPVKDFLLDYAVSKERDSVTRGIAVSSYLRAADAEEAKGALIRFLVEGDRMDSQSRSSILWSALMAYQDATAEKRKAIVESLYAALASEDNKWLFRVYDDILCQISTQYAHSLQRRDILTTLIKAPSLCKADDYAMPELEEKLRELKKTRLYTTINTNLAALKDRDFNLPLPEEERIALETPPNVTAAPAAAQDEPPQARRTNRTAFNVTVLVALAAAGVWVFRRRHGRRVP